MEYYEGKSITYFVRESGTTLDCQNERNNMRTKIMYDRITLKDMLRNVTSEMSTTVTFDVTVMKSFSIAGFRREIKTRSS